MVETKVAELCAEARDELARIEALGVLAAVESGYLKQRLVEANGARLAADRVRRAAGGRRQLLHRQRAPSPLAADADGGFLAVGGAAEADQIERLKAHRATGDPRRAAAAALAELRQAAAKCCNVMEPSIACARAGITTGEWPGALRELFGEYRAPTGPAGRLLLPP